MGSDLQTRRRSALSGRLTSITVVPKVAGGTGEPEAVGGGFLDADGGHGAVGVQGRDCRGVSG